MKKWWFPLIWYLIPGFSAPLIFTFVTPKHLAGFFAGALFLCAALWALFLSVKHRFPAILKAVFVLTLSVQICFWVWRLGLTTPLNESVLLGLTGDKWHHGLTAVYFFVASCLWFNLKK